MATILKRFNRSTASTNLTFILVISVYISSCSFRNRLEFTNRLNKLKDAIVVWNAVMPLSLRFSLFIPICTNNLEFFQIDSLFLWPKTNLSCKYIKQIYYKYRIVRYMGRCSFHTTGSRSRCESGCNSSFLLRKFANNKCI